MIIFCFASLAIASNANSLRGSPTKDAKWEWRVFTKDIELARKYGWDDFQVDANNTDNGNRTDVYVYSPGNDAGVKYRSVGAKDVEVKLLNNQKDGGYKVYQKIEGLPLSSAGKLCGKDANGLPKFEPAVAINVEAKKSISKRRIEHGEGKANRVTEEQNTVEVNGEQWYSVCFDGVNFDYVEQEVNKRFGFSKTGGDLSSLIDEGFFIGGYPGFVRVVVHRAEMAATLANSRGALTATQTFQRNNNAAAADMR
jgi:hypothetical protein